MRLLIDFFVWIGEALWPAPPPPKTALGRVDGRAVLLRYDGSAYAPEREARAGDRAPLLLGPTEALTGRFETAPEAALHGRAAARIEAARRCPFPLIDGAWAVERVPEAWRGGAPWRFAAAPDAKIAAAVGAVAASGAKAERAFAMVEGSALFLAARRSLPLGAAVAAPLAAAVVAMISHAVAEGGIGAAADEELAAARAALDAAEAEAAAAAGRRDEA
ncbi:MAG: hypothetical protein AAGF90_19495, partial [Pseudomonadota bacterium]